MERSDSINELAQALFQAQGSIHGVNHDKDNPFTNSTYASLAAILSAVKPG